MPKIKIGGVEFETVGKPKIVPYNEVTKELLDAYKKSKDEKDLHHKKIRTGKIRRRSNKALKKKAS